MEGTWFQSLVQKDSAYCRATKPVGTLLAHMFQLLEVRAPRSLLCDNRRHCNRVALLAATRKPSSCSEDPEQPKINVLESRSDFASNSLCDWLLEICTFHPSNYL